MEMCECADAQFPMEGEAFDHVSFNISTCDSQNSVQGMYSLKKKCIEISQGMYSLKKTCIELSFSVFGFSFYVRILEL